MNPVQNSLFLRALRREPVPRTPMWIMRQAGRYLPEYRQVRAEAGDFLSLCRDPARACEVVLQPLRRFNLDAAILFSDILTIPDAMGLGLYFETGEGPKFRHPLQLSSVETLTMPDVNTTLDYVMAAARTTRAALPADMPLIGFSGSPWTLACYMIEGSSSRTFPHIVDWKTNAPTALHHVLSLLAETVAEYLLAQIKAGVDVVMLFDTWGGLLSTPDYLTFSLRPMQQIIQRLKQAAPEVPIIMFTKGGGGWAHEMASTGCDVIGLDWTVNLGDIRAQVGDKVALQGNLDPTILLQDDATIRHGVKAVLDAYGKGSGHIFNLGHGITPDVDPAKVAVLVDAVQAYSPYYHEA